MEDAKKTKLQLAGVNLYNGAKRFMNNEALYEKFLVQFPSDLNMQILREALAAQDVPPAFCAAHTLLGVAANLSMEVFFDALYPLTQALREGNIDLAKRNMPDVEKAYVSILEALK